MLTLKIIALSFVFLFIKWIWSRRDFYLLSLKMPGPISLPFLGSTINLLLQPDTPLLWIQNLSKKYESFCLWIGSTLHVIVTKTEDIDLVLSSSECINRGDFARFFILDAIGAESIFTLEDEQWKKSRRIIAPSLNYNVVVNYLPIFNKHAMHCVDQLRKHVGSGPFNFRPYVEEATSFSFVQSTMGRDTSVEDMRKYGSIVSKRQKLIQKRLVRPWFYSNFIWNLSKYGREAKQIVKEEEKLKEKIFGHLDDASPDAALLCRLLRPSNNDDRLTRDEIQSEVITIMVSGTESTTGPISITLLLLAMHPDIQDKVVEELKQILPNQQSPVTREDLNKMHYLDMCIQEELRLFPSVPLTVRKNKNVLPIQNYELPVGTSIVISFHQLHRNPVYWGPNAEKFDPNRFSSENIGKIVPFSYIPFGMGTRGCIGNTYSMIVIKTMLATILRNYKVTTQLKMEDLTVDSSITIIVNDSCMPVQLETRDY